MPLDFKSRSFEHEWWPAIVICETKRGAHRSSIKSASEYTKTNRI